MNKTLFALAGLAVAFFPAAVSAEEHEVKMLNSLDGEMMVFEPAFLKVAEGDTVKFVATDKAHNAESILGMVPNGADQWKGKINEEITVTLTEPGLYGYKCLPHYGMGMVGIIRVGDAPPANLDEALAIKHPGRAASRMAVLFENVEAD
jgi:pseudoazurin